MESGGKCKGGHHYNKSTGRPRRHGCKRFLQKSFFVHSECIEKNMRQTNLKLPATTNMMDFSSGLSNYSEETCAAMELAPHDDNLSVGEPVQYDKTG